MSQASTYIFVFRGQGFYLLFFDQILAKAEVLPWPDEQFECGRLIGGMDDEDRMKGWGERDGTMARSDGLGEGTLNK